MTTEPSLITELESAMQSGSQEKRVETLRRITDLFAVDADRLNDREIDVFDGVLAHLIERIQGQALAELSQRLGPIKNAPAGVVRRLASHEDIAIAGPVLTQSPRLTEQDLIEIAKSKPQAHLLAISGRSAIDKSVTDVLLQRGDSTVVHKLAENNGANFSENGFVTLAKHSEHDEQLAEKIALRQDVPLPVFQELLKHATEVVRSRLLAVTGPETRACIQTALANISDVEQTAARTKHEHDFAKAHALALVLQNNGELSESTILDYARNDRYADMLAALSLLCRAPMELVENLLQSKHREGFLIPCKVAGLRWTTVSIMMTFRSGDGRLSGAEHDTLRNSYLKLSESAAARVIRFWQVRQTASKDAPLVRQSPTASPIAAA